MSYSILLKFSSLNSLSSLNRLFCGRIFVSLVLCQHPPLGTSFRIEHNPGLSATKNMTMSFIRGFVVSVYFEQANMVGSLKCTFFCFHFLISQCLLTCFSSGSSFLLSGGIICQIPEFSIHFEVIQTEFSAQWYSPNTILIW